MCGHVGSEWRVGYTAVGDLVTTASRLDAMTKGFEHSVLVAETTRERLQRGAPDVVYVDPREVRGRQANASLWTLAGDGAGPARAASGY